MQRKKHDPIGDPMTATDTSSPAELLALATDLSNDKPGSRTRAAELLRRLADKPADDGVREVTIEECVAVLEGLRDQAKRNRDRKVGTRKQGVARGHGTRVNRVMVLGVAIRAIRALSPKAKP